MWNAIVTADNRMQKVKGDKKDHFFFFVHTTAC